MIKFVASKGEPFKWGILDISREKISTFLLELGLELVEHLAPGESKEFFTKKWDGTYVGKFSGVFHYVIARVP